MAVQEIESESLPAHVAACAERYKTLFNRLEAVQADVVSIRKRGFTIALWIIAKLLALLIGGAALFWQMHTAKADVPACAMRETYVELLALEYHEHQAGGGLNGAGALIELWVAKDGSWTLTLSQANGFTCVITDGEAWDPLPDPKPQERES